MKMNISRKIILIITLILLFLLILVIFKNPIIQWIDKRISESKLPSSIETTAYYEIISQKDDTFQILLNIENQKGIDQIVAQDITLKCNGKTKIALDRTLKENESYQLKIKLVGETTEELYTLVAYKVPDFKITNEDTFSDGTTTTLEIQYANNENLINYYSFDQGKTWQVYTAPINIPTINDYVIVAKSEWREGKTIQNTEYSYPFIATDSLLSATKNSISNSGYYRIAIKDEEYYVHAYVEDSDLTITNNTTYGDQNDIATASEYAKHMVILKVNGNLTVEQGATLTAYSSSYGGPKGMLIYSTDTLTNNGTISMTAKGAKAEGQNVYLLRNADKSYEYVPAVGANGGQAISINAQVNGNNGINGTERQTGGGGTGSGFSYSSHKVNIGAGGKGTSYSGGSGSGGAFHNSSGSGSSDGGIGGYARASYYTNYFDVVTLGGTGNPTGSYAYSIPTHDPSPNGNQPGDYFERKGTGGLLMIYSLSLDNKGTISSNGISSSTATSFNKGNPYWYYDQICLGGASGGGSINIFYSSLLNKGTITANGGTIITGGKFIPGGAGGNGTVSIGDISSGTYTEYNETVEDT